MAKDGVAWCHYLSGSPDRPSGCGASCCARTTFAGMALALEWNAGTPAQLALIADDAGRWDEAGELVAEAERLCPRMGLDETMHHSIFLPMLLAHLRLMSHRGDPETIGFARTIDDYMKDMVRNRPW